MTTSKVVIALKYVKEYYVQIIQLYNFLKAKEYQGIKFVLYL